MSYETIRVEPLSPVIGAEIHGIDLSKPLTNREHAEVHDALLKHCVIFFRDQEIDLEQQKAFGRRFGKLHIHPTAPSPEGHPEILVIKADENARSGLLIRVLDEAKLGGAKDVSIATEKG